MCFLSLKSDTIIHKRKKEKSDLRYITEIVVEKLKIKFGSPVRSDFSYTTVSI